MISNLERRLLMVTACMTCTLLMALPVAAQSTDVPRNPIGVVVGADVIYDSNLFRQPSSDKLTADTLAIGYVGLRIDTQQSLQRFQLDITETVRRYAKTTQLNFDSLDYRGAWLWQVGSRVSGTLSADRKESLAPFEDALNPGSTVRNVRINENRVFTLDAAVFADWHLLLGAIQSTQKSEQAIQIQPDFKAVAYEAGVKYTPSTGSSVSAIRRTSSGDYLNQSSSPVLGTGYRQDESELRVLWIASGKSTLSGRLTWIERTQEGAAQRNFSGLAGEFLYAWTPTGKLSMNLVARRDVAPFQDLRGSYIVSNTLSFAPTWSITAKTTARLQVAHSTTQFAGAASAPVFGSSRSDKLNLIDIGLDWSPANRLLFSAGLLHQVRDSNVPGFDFKDTIARISASYRF